MSTLGFASIGALLAAVALPMAARAAADDVRDDAWLNQSMSQYRQSSSDQLTWQNPHLPQASVSYVAVAATDDAGGARAGADATESADQRLTRIVAQYDQAMLDRGGWENPYLPSVAAGNALSTVAVGEGLTLPGSAPSLVKTPAQEGDAREEEGAASGEPQVDPQPQGK